MNSQIRQLDHAMQMTTKVCADAVSITFISVLVIIDHRTFTWKSYFHLSTNLSVHRHHSIPLREQSLEIMRIKFPCFFIRQVCVIILFCFKLRKQSETATVAVFILNGNIAGSAISVMMTQKSFKAQLPSGSLLCIYRDQAPKQYLRGCSIHNTLHNRWNRSEVDVSGKSEHAGSSYHLWGS